MNRKPTVLVMGAVVAALAIAGCGGGGSSSSTSASTTPAPAGGGSSSAGSAKSNLSLAADASGKLAFNKKTLSAKSGTVTITMDNPSSVPHGIAVTGNGVNQSGSTVTKGGKSTVTVKLKPGTYTFYCPVDGHRAAGMQGTLTIK
ncbi:MAG TPA: plastocyanin/azurin family copper-binding protein [Thermoleophilaceae bacterium]|nr:plastocyanin/azurin family copper-binding protein [Thermoleophilaceae bacterium]